MLMSSVVIDVVHRSMKMFSELPSIDDSASECMAPSRHTEVWGGGVVESSGFCLSAFNVVDECIHSVSFATPIFY